MSARPSSVSQRPALPVSQSNTFELSAPASAPTRRRSSARVALHLTYSCAQAVLSVWNALATQSFSAAQAKGSVWWSEGSVFAISAILEAVGLTYGVCMATLQYNWSKDRGLWGDLLSDPYTVAVEGMFDEGERGDFLFRAGLMGMYILFVCFLAANAVLSILSGQHAIGIVFSVLTCASVLVGRRVLGLFAACMRKREWAAKELLPSPSTVYILCAAPPLWIEAMEAFFLVRSDVSVSNVFLVALDVVVLLPLAILLVGIVSAGAIAWLHGLCRSTIFVCFGHMMPETCFDHVRRRMALGRFVPEMNEDKAMWWATSKGFRRQ